VLSTLHTNGTAETFARLADMGLPSYLIASSVQLVVAQRLVRRVCGCAAPAVVDPAMIERYGLTETQLATAVLKKAVGCKRCMNTGYKGRVAVYEMVAPSAALREVLRTGGSENDIVACMRGEGVKWMWDSGIDRALAGETTLEEVGRVINPPDK
jgi:type II secretory ATPase GspE/PulE/Tfp pilus assembly ATPase PilB-like protein